MKLLFILVLVLYATATEYPIPFAQNAKDEFIVSYLEAPLFKASFGDLMAKINAYHVGVGFKNVKTNQMYTVDYIASTSVLAATFPALTETNDLYFRDGGHVQFNKTGIDYAYWTKEMPVFKINGEQMNKYMCWAVQYNRTFTNYQLFAVYNSTRPLNWNQVEQPIVNSSTCIDFAWFSFQFFQDIGATPLASTEVLFRDLMYLLSNDAPIPIDYTTNKAKLINFYSQFHFENVTWEVLFERIVYAFQGAFFLHTPPNNYYQIVLQRPYAGFNYTGFTIPPAQQNAPAITYPTEYYCNNYNPGSSNGKGPIIAAVLISVIGVPLLFVALGLFGYAMILVWRKYRASRYEAINS